MADTFRGRPVRRRLPSALHPFQSHAYRLLWPSGFLFYTTRWMQVTLLGWLILELTNSAFRVALVGFFTAAPLLVLGLVGGLLADSVHRQAMLRASQVCNAVAVIGMTILLYTGQVQYWHGYLAVLASGVAWAMENPIRRSMMLDLHGSSGVANAMALETTAITASRMVGPALAGGLIVAIDVRGGYVVAAAFAVAAATLVWWPKLPLPSAPARAKQSPAKDLAQGLDYVRSTPTILGAVLVTAVMNLFLYPYLQIMPVVARDVLKVGPGHMGILQAADGMGALVGAIVIALTANRIRHLGRIYVGGAALAMVALLAFSFSRWYGLSLPTLVVLGLGTSGFSAMQATIVMLVARGEMRGRALGAVSIAIGMGPIGALLIGGMADALDPSTAIRLDAIVALSLTTLIWALIPGLRGHIGPVKQR